MSARIRQDAADPQWFIPSTLVQDHADQWSSPRPQTSPQPPSLLPSQLPTSRPHRASAVSRACFCCRCTLYPSRRVGTPRRSPPPAAPAFPADMRGSRAGRERRSSLAAGSVVVVPGARQRDDGGLAGGLPLRGMTLSSLGWSWSCMPALFFVYGLENSVGTQLSFGGHRMDARLGFRG